VERVALKTGEAEPIDISADDAAGIATPAAAPEIASAQESTTTRLTRLAKRWFALNRGTLRAVLLGALSLMVFLVAWHFLTKYRVNIYVRFLNVRRRSRCSSAPDARSATRNSSPTWH